MIEFKSFRIIGNEVNNHQKIIISCCLYISKQRLFLNSVYLILYSKILNGIASFKGILIYISQIGEKVNFNSHFRFLSCSHILVYYYFMDKLKDFRVITYIIFHKPTHIYHKYILQVYCFHFINVERKLSNILIDNFVYGQINSWLIIPQLLLDWTTS